MCERASRIVCIPPPSELPIRLCTMKLMFHHHHLGKCVMDGVFVLNVINKERERAVKVYLIMISKIS